MRWPYRLYAFLVHDYDNTSVAYAFGERLARAGSGETPHSEAATFDKSPAMFGANNSGLYTINMPVKDSMWRAIVDTFPNNGAFAVVSRPTPTVVVSSFAKIGAVLSWQEALEIIKNDFGVDVPTVPIEAARLNFNYYDRGRDTVQISGIIDTAHNTATIQRHSGTLNIAGKNAVAPTSRHERLQELIEAGWCVITPNVIDGLERAAMHVCGTHTCELYYKTPCGLRTIEHPPYSILYVPNTFTLLAERSK
jgi:hypothetical protein